MRSARPWPAERPHGDLSKAILKAAKTGKIGDGKIFMSKIDEAIRIRDEERGEAAL
jgi:nitrogen regulatory protein PII